VNHDATVFLQGVSSLGAYACALFFLRFWRESRDTLFAFFSAAFLFLGLSWTLLAFFAPAEDTRPYIYGLRLVAFALIIIGTVLKNRGSSPS
jgi:hypothetical protein